MNTLNEHRSMRIVAEQMLGRSQIQRTNIMWIVDQSRKSVFQMNTPIDIVCLFFDLFFGICSHDRSTRKCRVLRLCQHNITHFRNGSIIFFDSFIVSFGMTYNIYDFRHIECEFLNDYYLLFFIFFDSGVNTLMYATDCYFTDDAGTDTEFCWFIVGFGHCYNVLLHFCYLWTLNDVVIILSHGVVQLVSIIWENLFYIRKLLFLEEVIFRKIALK